MKTKRKRKKKPVKCKHCGKRHDYGTLWCHYCGSDVDESEQP